MRVLILVASIVLAVSAHARWKAEYAQRSPEEQAWYQRQQTTPEWRARMNKPWYMSCCDHSDTVEAEFSKDGSGWKFRRPGETQWTAIPGDVVEEDIPTPHSKPVLFVDSTGYNLGPVCFFPGAAGA